MCNKKVTLFLMRFQGRLSLLLLLLLTVVAGGQESDVIGSEAGFVNFDPNDNVPAEVRPGGTDFEVINLDEKIEQLYEKLRQDPLDEQSIREIRQLRDQREQSQKNGWANLANALQGCLDNRPDAVRGHLERVLKSAAVVKLADSYLSVSLKEFLARCEEKISKPICLECGNTHRADCTACRGRGMVRCPKCKGRGSIRGRNEREEIRMVFCPECSGRGEVVCEKCSGTGIQECEKCSREGNVDEPLIDERVTREIEFLLPIVRYLQVGGLDYYSTGTAGLERGELGPMVELRREEVDFEDYSDSLNLDPFSLTEPTVGFELRFDIRITGGRNRFFLTVELPRSIPGRQRLTQIKYSHEPLRTWLSGPGSYAEFDFSNQDKDFTLLITGQAAIEHYDLARAIRQKNNLNYDVEMAKDFLADEYLLEVNADEIREAAGKITGDNQLELVRQIHAFVVSRLRYQFYKENKGALWALRNGCGDCDEYTALFVSLCRAKKIPARWIIGTTLTWENTPKHSWAEVFLGELGWVPFDPTNNQRAGSNPGKLRPIYFYESIHRYDAELDGNFFFYYRYWGSKPEVERRLILKGIP
ncbi:MAG: hypothetical protein JXD22_10060 [Sedimentisphaerales bacterium]|nr:hypothetical protein [Sedimentisphaerales bacterium]